MKKHIFFILVLLTQMNFAQAVVLGTFVGMTSGQEHCSIKIGERTLGSSPSSSVYIEMDTEFKSKIFDKNSFSFDMNKVVFDEEAQTGVVDRTNILENVWTDFYQTQNLSLRLNSDGTPDEFTVTVKDDRWWRDQIEDSQTCFIILD